MPITRTGVLIAGLLVAVPVAAVGQHNAFEDGFSLALTGDSIITRRLSVYGEPDFLAMIEVLRTADAAFTNLEMLFHDYEPYPAYQSGGTYMRGDPGLADELVWAGFDLVSRANNHAGDYGVLGLQLTSQHVKRSGLVEAGVGASIKEAREARYLETGRGRVALISVASYFPPHMKASASRGDVPARPGLNPLLYETRYLLPRADFEILADVAHKLDRRENYTVDTSFEFLGDKFFMDEEARIERVIDQRNLEQILQVVRSAESLSDVVLVSIHAHESDGDRTIPARFLQEFGRLAIEAGASAVVGHGPHVLRGVEIFNGAPIFYSLGNFIFQNETLLRLPQENYDRFGLDEEAQIRDFNDARYSGDTSGYPAMEDAWRTVIAVPTWQGGKMKDVTFHPVTLGFGEPRTVRGRPMLATGALAQEILEQLAQRSVPYGTHIQIIGGIGKLTVH